MKLNRVGGSNRAGTDKSLAIELDAECWQCPYLEQPVVFSDGPKDAEIAIVGIAPHTEEIRTSKPFVGPSGKLLDKALETTALERDDCLVTNAVLCRPRGTTTPCQEALNCCFPRLQREVQGKKIVTMGDVPRRQLVKSSLDKKITEIRGSWFENEEIGPCLVTNHPAMCLRSNPDSFLDIANDLKKLVLGPQRVPEVEYEVITTFERLKEIIVMIPPDEPFIFDLETSNVDNERSTPGERWNSYILSCAFCWEPGQAYVIPTELWNTFECHDLMLPIFTRPGGLVGHNVKFDILHVQESYLRQFDPEHKIEMLIDDDTLLMHYVLDERRGTHGLKILSGLFEDPDYDGVLHTYLKKPRVESYSKVPRPILYRYNAKDVDYTIRLLHRFKEELIQKKLYIWPYKNVLLESLEVLTEAESIGMYLHRDTLEESKATLELIVNYFKLALQVIAADLYTDMPLWWEDKEIKTIEDLTTRLHEEREKLTGKQALIDLNPNSPQQVSKIIYGQLGFKTPRGRSIKPGSTNKEALDKLNTQYSHPFTAHLKQYRRYNKLLTTYANKLANFCDHNDFTHFEYNLAGSVTGRVAAGLLLTIPRSYTPEGKLIRNCFGAPNECTDTPAWMREILYSYMFRGIPDWRKRVEEILSTHADCGIKLIDADYSQAELRLLGWFGDDEFLYDVYNNNRDLHSEATSRMFNMHLPTKADDDAYKALWKEQRMKAKMLNFAMAYSAETSENSFAEDTGVPVVEARSIIRSYSETLSGVSAWKERTTDQARAVGWVRTPTGRYRRFPLITSQSAHEMMNQAVNFPVQSTSNDITLISFSRLSREFRQKRWPVWPVLFMHDGIYFICLDDGSLLEEVSQRVTTVMEETAYEIQDMGIFPEYQNKQRMPFTADLSIKTRW